MGFVALLLVGDFRVSSSVCVACGANRGGGSKTRRGLLRRRGRLVRCGGRLVRLKPQVIWLRGLLLLRWLGVKGLRIMGFVALLLVGDFRVSSSVCVACGANRGGGSKTRRGLLRRRGRLVRLPAGYKVKG